MSPPHTLLLLLVLVAGAGASINIATLPPDLRRLEFLDSLPPRSTINPVWSGDYTAALDGEMNKVLVSWTVLRGDTDEVEFQVRGLHLLHTLLMILVNLPRPQVGMLIPKVFIVHIRQFLAAMSIKFLQSFPI